MLREPVIGVRRSQGGPGAASGGVRVSVHEEPQSKVDVGIRPSHARQDNATAWVGDAALGHGGPPAPKLGAARRGAHPSPTAGRLHESSG